MKMNKILNLITIIIISIMMRVNDTAAVIVLFGCGLSFLIFGILFLNNKGTSIFSIIYNKPKDTLEKHYDKKALFLFEGRLAIILSFGFFALIAGIYFEIIWLIYSVTGYWILVYLCSIIYSKNGKRFRI